MGFLRRKPLAEEDRVRLHPCHLPLIYEPQDRQWTGPLLGEGSVWQCDECGKIWIAEWNYQKLLTWERPYPFEEYLIRRKLKR